MDNGKEYHPTIRGPEYSQGPPSPELRALGLYRRWRESGNPDDAIILDHHLVRFGDLKGEDDLLQRINEASLLE